MRTCRVGPGDCRTRASHRSGRAGCRIRLLESWVCYAMAEPETPDRTREREAPFEMLKTLPRHPGFVGAAIEPLTPKPADFVSPPVQRREVAEDPVVVVVAPEFPYELLVLPGHGLMTNRTKPFGAPFQSPAEATA